MRNLPKVLRMTQPRFEPWSLTKQYRTLSHMPPANNLPQGCICSGWGSLHQSQSIQDVWFAPWRRGTACRHCPGRWQWSCPRLLAPQEAVDKNHLVKIAEALAFKSLWRRFVSFCCWLEGACSQDSSSFLLPSFPNMFKQDGTIPWTHLSENFLNTNLMWEMEKGGGNLLKTSKVEVYIFLLNFRIIHRSNQQAQII